MIFTIVSVNANDSRVINGGTVQIIDNKNTNIQIINEEIVIKFFKEYFTVNVDYIYRNYGDTETVLIGFPIRASVQEYDIANVKIDSFEHVLNGVKIESYDEKTEQNKDGFYYDIKKWYLRKMLFPGNADSYSSVSYKSTYSHAGFSTFSQYILGSASSWKGNISNFKLKLVVSNEVMITNCSIAEFNNLNAPKKFHAIKNGFEFILNDFQIKNDDYINIGIQEYQPMKGYSNEFGDFNEGWMWDKFTIYRSSPDEILLYTKDQLQLFINTFYAIHGYDFKKKELKEYFESNPNIFSETKNKKYVVNQNFNDTQFNEIEKKNIEYLRKLLKVLYPDT